jgi:hypothetical protein
MDLLVTPLAARGHHLTIYLSGLNFQRETRLMVPIFLLFIKIELIVRTLKLYLTLGDVGSFHFGFRRS